MLAYSVQCKTHFRTDVNVFMRHIDNGVSWQRIVSYMEPKTTDYFFPIILGRKNVTNYSKI